MDAIPTRIAGVRIARQMTTRRADGSVVKQRPSWEKSRWRFETVAADSGFTAEPGFTCRASLRRTVTCTDGEVYVAVVDMRRHSPTFRQWQGFYLARGDQRTLLVPRGVAVGWQVSSVVGEVEMTYSAAPQPCDWSWLCWDDAHLSIHWPQEPTGFAKQRAASREFDGFADSQLPLYRSVSRANRKRRSQPNSARRATRAAKKNDSMPQNNKPRVTPEPLIQEVRPVHKAPEQPMQRIAMQRESVERRSRPILVLGSSGQLGADLVRHLRTLGPVIGASRTPQAGTLLPVPVQVDVSRPASLRHAIRTVQPALIVNATGMTNVDLAERQPRLAQLVNATAPAIMAEEARKIGAGLVHFCSDMVFGGAGERPFREDDFASPGNQFARTKLTGTSAVESLTDEHLVFRTGWLYSTRGDNYVKQMMDLMAYRNSISLPSDHIGCPVSTDWLAATLAEILTQAEGDYAGWMSEQGGLYHASMLGYASRVEVGDQILASCKSQGVPIALSHIQARPLASLPTMTPVPANCRLDPTRLAKTFGLKLPRWQAELDRKVAQMVAESMRVRQVA